MDWQKLADKHAEQYKRGTINCSDPEEKKYIIDIILKEFPSLNRNEVEREMERCCETFYPYNSGDIFLAIISALKG